MIECGKWDPTGEQGSCDNPDSRSRFSNFFVLFWQLELPSVPFLKEKVTDINSNLLQND